MRRKQLVALLLMVLLVFTMSAVGAEKAPDMFFDGEAEGKIDGCVFSAGQDTGSKASVKGILFTAGYNVNAGGESEYTMAAGYKVNLSGYTANDVFAAGNAVVIDGAVERDLFAAGNAISIKGKIGRTVYAAGNTVTLKGIVGGDIYVSAQKIFIDSSAAIGGTLHYNSDALIEAPEDVLGNAEIYVEDAPDSQEAEAPKTTGFFGSVLKKFLGFLGIVVVAYALLLFTKTWEVTDKKYYNAPFEKYAKAFGIGFAVLVAIPVASLLLFVSNIGIKLAVILLMLYVAALLAASVFFAFFIGSLIYRKLFSAKPCYWAELPIGIFVYVVAGCIPFIGGIVKFIAVTLGLGVLTLFLGKKKCPNEESPVPEKSINAENSSEEN